MKKQNPLMIIGIIILVLFLISQGKKESNYFNYFNWQDDCISELNDKEDNNWVCTRRCVCDTDPYSCGGDCSGGAGCWELACYEGSGGCTNPTAGEQDYTCQSGDVKKCVSGSWVKQDDCQDYPGYTSPCDEENQVHSTESAAVADCTTLETGCIETEEGVVYYGTEKTNYCSDDYNYGTDSTDCLIEENGKICEEIDGVGQCVYPQECTNPLAFDGDYACRDGDVDKCISESWVKQDDCEDYEGYESPCVFSGTSSTESGAASYCTLSLPKCSNPIANEGQWICKDDYIKVCQWGQWELSYDCDYYSGYTTPCTTTIPRDSQNEAKQDCTECECSSGICCSDGCNYNSNDEICDWEYQTEYSCSEGTDCGDNVGVRYKHRYCSGSSALCTGSISSWTSYSLYDDCTLSERCVVGDSSCNYDSSCVTQTCSQLGGSCKDESCGSYTSCTEKAGASDCSGKCCSGVCSDPIQTCSQLDGDCKSLECDKYDDCESLSGTCTSGHCCSGDCTTIIPVKTCASLSGAWKQNTCSSYNTNTTTYTDITSTVTSAADKNEHSGMNCCKPKEVKEPFDYMILLYVFGGLMAFALIMKTMGGKK